MRSLARPTARAAPRAAPAHAAAPLRARAPLGRCIVPPSALPDPAAATAAFAALADAAPSALFKVPGVVGDSPFTEGAVSGFLLILFSELGDKTFFIALLLALRRDRTAVFAGTFGALAVMTCISVREGGGRGAGRNGARGQGAEARARAPATTTTPRTAPQVGLGRALHSLDGVLPSLGGLPVDDVLATVLLTVFGLRTLAAAGDAEAAAAEEKGEAEDEVEAFTAAGAAVALSTFVLVFAAEWGDKSFLATIALAAASDPAGVVLGAIAGHGVATALAVAGGGALASRVSERAVAYVGGGLFLVFAAATAIDIVRGI